MSFPTSPQTTINASAAAVLTTLLSGYATVAIRDEPYVDPDLDTLPLCLVIPQGEKKGKEQFRGQVFMMYPTLVVLVRAGNGAHQDGPAIAEGQDVRAAIRHALFQPLLSGASTVFDCVYDPEPLDDVLGLAAQYRVSVQGFEFHSREDR